MTSSSMCSGDLHIRVLHPLITVALRVNGLRGLSSPMWDSPTDAQRRTAAEAILWASQALDRSCQGLPGYTEVAPSVERFINRYLR
jgi:hypothetical protein